MWVTEKKMRNHTLRKLNMEFFPVHGIIIAINISSVTGKKKGNVHSKAIAVLKKQRNYLKYKLQMGHLDRNNYCMK